MSFVFGFLTAWAILSAILFAAEEFGLPFVVILCHNAVFVLMTLPISAPAMLVAIIVKYVKILFYAVKSKLKSAKR